MVLLRTAVPGYIPRVSRKKKAARILKAQIQAGYHGEHAAEVAASETGLAIVTGGPVPCQCWSFFLVSRDGTRVLGRQRVFRSLE